MHDYIRFKWLRSLRPYTVRMLPSVTEHLQAIVDSVRDQDSGELADYIDVLKHADPDKLALAMCTTDGHLYAVGDAD